MTTPARRQYLEIKSKHQDAILFYQVGDFYETFDEDAHIASRELNIVLTGRSYGPEEYVPLAGVPLHALETYAARLVARGYTVAVCDQISPPGHGLVQRAVARVLTPGTAVAPSMLSPTRDICLAAVVLRYVRSGRITAAGLAYMDASTGAFHCTEWTGIASGEALRAELERLSPSELLADERALSLWDSSREGGCLTVDTSVTSIPFAYFDVERARARLCRQFRTETLAAFVRDDQPLAIASAGAILAYLERVNPTLLRQVSGLRSYDASDFVQVDGRTWRALEVVEPASAAYAEDRAASRATLLSVLDTTLTAMGARLLRRTLLHPLADRHALTERLDAVAELYASQALRERLTTALSGLHDIERLVGRVAQGVATARETHALRMGLARARAVADALEECKASALVSLCAALDPCEEVQALIERAVVDPASPESGLILPGYDARLDELTASIADSRRWIAALETSERQRTGIKSLKVGFNQVFGYYIEVTRPNLALVPSDYHRRQTMANAERYVTPELKEHEGLVLRAQEQIDEVERALYAEVLEIVGRHHSRMRATAETLAQLDVFLALATIAVARDYVRPELTDEPVLEIAGGRHPIVEAATSDTFMPNDTRLGCPAVGGGCQIMLLTGPNMAGKSTYLRQVAAIVLLAQIGSYVPARSARIGIVDCIFTRLGADDNLARGLSTFMLEMVETAYILNHATERSLVILDEVGRGTSTRDGLAIARAVVEHLHDVTHARTLFATHYHELASSAASLERLGIYRMDVIERDGEAVFLHRVVLGASEHSYGVQVARMAGLPTSVTSRASDLLNASSPYAVPAVAEPVVSYAVGHEDRKSVPSAPCASATGLDPGALTLALASVNVAAMTPIEAINVLFTLQQRALAAISSGSG